jgi:flavin-dependent dehydrogenase
VNAPQVVIVGGGPVGLACAIFAAQAGLTALVLESGVSDGDKACGEGLMPGVKPLLDELGIDPPGLALVGVSYRQNAVSVDHRFPDTPGRGVRRTVLIDALRARADELGIERRLSRVSTVQVDPESVSLGLADGSTVQAAYVVACDGLHSTVARELGLTTPSPKRGRRYGLRQHFSTPPWSSFIEVYYAGSSELYITPVDSTTVGVAVLGPKGVNLSDTINQVPEVQHRLAGVASASSLRGAGPFPHRVRKAQVGRVLLVGDAAGYVDAITGEGLRVGFAQAREAIHAIATERPGSYPRRWRAVTREFRVLTRGLVMVASSPLRGSIVPLARALPRVFGLVVDRLAR